MIWVIYLFINVIKGRLTRALYPSVCGLVRSGIPRDYVYVPSKLYFYSVHQLDEVTFYTLSKILPFIERLQLCVQLLLFLLRPQDLVMR